MSYQCFAVVLLPDEAKGIPSCETADVTGDLSPGNGTQQLKVVHEPRLGLCGVMSFPSETLIHPAANTDTSNSPALTRPKELQAATKSLLQYVSQRKSYPKRNPNPQKYDQNRDATTPKVPPRVKIATHLHLTRARTALKQSPTTNTLNFR